MEKVAQINTYHMQQFAGWVEKMKAAKKRRQQHAR